MLYLRSMKNTPLSMPCLLCTTHAQTKTHSSLSNPIILCNYCYYHFFGIVCFGTGARFSHFKLLICLFVQYKRGQPLCVIQIESAYIFRHIFRMFSINSSTKIVTKNHPPVLDFFLLEQRFCWNSSHITIHSKY